MPRIGVLAGKFLDELSVGARVFWFSKLELAI
jgi:hypothetical protein